MKKPNVVLIVIDSLRADHLSCYGYGRPTTPAIDRIAGDGIAFERAFAASCWTIPSHGSLFTGLYPSGHGADFDTKYLAPDNTTLADRLGRLGYATANVTCNGFISGHTNLDQGFAHSVDAGGLKGSNQGLGRIIRGVHRRIRDATATDRGARRALKDARRWLGAQSGDQPFFLFMNFMDCHLPYWLRKDLLHRFVDPSDRARAAEMPQDPFGFMAGAIDLSPDDIRILSDMYDGALLYLDGVIGEIDRTVAEMGAREDTLFIVTSDHGESFGEGGLLDHQYSLRENLLRVPLVLRYPKRVEPGSGDPTRLVQLTDVIGTVADLAELSRNEFAVPDTSVSFFSPEPRSYAFAEYLVPSMRAFERRFPDYDVEQYDVALRSIRDDRMKLIQHEDGRVELFDLDADPEETRNRADDEPEGVERLAEAAHRVLGVWPRPRRSADEGDSVEDIRDRLEALGYM